MVKNGVKRRIQTYDKFHNNPKLEGSNIIDCIPQTGPCPNKCLECFYNGDGFFRTKTEPLIPTKEEVGKKLVRVNSGHDSGIQKKRVIEATLPYKKKFFNTSLTDFDFPGPVVFTCNGRDTDLSALMVVKNIDNLMMVRFRTNLWNLDLLDEVISYYAVRYKIPVTITYMRYLVLENIPRMYRPFYVYKTSILNKYYVLNTEFQTEILENRLIPSLSQLSLVGRCGTVDSSYCKDCNRCLKLYENFLVKLGWESTLGILPKSK